MRDARRRPALGLTFLEMFLVVAVLGVLSTVVLPTARTLRRRSMERDLQRGLEQIRKALDEYHLDWEAGCVEAEDEFGWPRTLEELTVEIELADEPQCLEEQPAPALPDEPADEPVPVKKTYLRRLPADPFNSDPENTWDVSGWKARSYDDDFDSTSWRGNHVYDVYSSTDLKALDGSKLADR